LKDAELRWHNLPLWEMFFDPKVNKIYDSTVAPALKQVKNAYFAAGTKMTNHMPLTNQVLKAASDSC